MGSARTKTIPALICLQWSISWASVALREQRLALVVRGFLDRVRSRGHLIEARTRLLIKLALEVVAHVFGRVDVGLDSELRQVVQLCHVHGEGRLLGDL